MTSTRAGSDIAENGSYHKWVMSLHPIPPCWRLSWETDDNGATEQQDQSYYLSENIANNITYHHDQNPLNRFQAETDQYGRFITTYTGYESPGSLSAERRAAMQFELESFDELHGETETGVEKTKKKKHHKHDKLGKHESSKGNKDHKKKHSHKKTKWFSYPTTKLLRLFGEGKGGVSLHIHGLIFRLSGIYLWTATGSSRTGVRKMNWSECSSKSLNWNNWPWEQIILEGLS